MPDTPIDYRKLYLELRAVIERTLSLPAVSLNSEAKCAGIAAFLDATKRFAAAAPPASGETGGEEVSDEKPKHVLAICPTWWNADETEGDAKDVAPWPLDEATIERMAMAAMKTFYRDPYDTREKPHLARWSGSIRAAMTELVEGE